MCGRRIHTRLKNIWTTNEGKDQKAKGKAVRIAAKGQSATNGRKKDRGLVGLRILRQESDKSKIQHLYIVRKAPGN